MNRGLFFCGLTGCCLMTLLAGCSQGISGSNQDAAVRLQPAVEQAQPANPITLFMAGDVMTGRGIDQILPHSVDPQLHEPVAKSAESYVRLAEQANGPIPEPVDFAYIWGDALAELERLQPDVRLINLETSITTSDVYWPGKRVHYRMHPENIPVLKAAKIDYCSLANNHVLDWGYAGLTETLTALEQAEIQYAGAGQNLPEAAAPVVVDVKEKGRVIILSFGLTSSGIPVDWAAEVDRAGVNLLPDLSDGTVQDIRENVAAVKQAGDIVIASIHWGGNWGYEIPAEQRTFAHKLIDEAGIDIIHGHSSHHVKAIEVYQGRLILYGAGDFLNDYEGIRGYEEFRDDLTLIYFASVDPATGRLVQLQMTPLQIEQFRLKRASPDDAEWLSAILNQEGQQFGTQVALNRDQTLTLSWD